MDEKDFWVAYRSVLLNQARQLLEQRAAVLSMVATIEKRYELRPNHAPLQELSQSVTSTPQPQYKGNGQS